MGISGMRRTRVRAVFELRALWMKVPAMLIHALVTHDWVQSLMKGAANCAEHCEMHKFVSKW